MLEYKVSKVLTDEGRQVMFEIATNSGKLTVSSRDMVAMARDRITFKNANVNVQTGYISVKSTVPREQLPMVRVKKYIVAEQNNLQSVIGVELEFEGKIDVVSYPEEFNNIKRQKPMKPIPINNMNTTYLLSNMELGLFDQPQIARGTDTYLTRAFKIIGNLDKSGRIPNLKPYRVFNMVSSRYYGVNVTGKTKEMLAKFYLGYRQDNLKLCVKIEKDARCKYKFHMINFQSTHIVTESELITGLIDFKWVIGNIKYMRREDFNNIYLKFKTDIRPSVTEYFILDKKAKSITKTDRDPFIAGVKKAVSTAASAVANLGEVSNTGVANTSKPLTISQNTGVSNTSRTTENNVSNGEQLSGSRVASELGREVLFDAALGGFGGVVSELTNKNATVEDKQRMRNGAIVGAVAGALVLGPAGALVFGLGGANIVHRYNAVNRMFTPKVKAEQKPTFKVTMRDTQNTGNSSGKRGKSAEEEYNDLRKKMYTPNRHGLNSSDFIDEFISKNATPEDKKRVAGTGTAGAAIGAVVGGPVGAVVGGTAAATVAHYKNTVRRAKEEQN